ncbi:TOBE domain-containing protein, partial [Geitlerinema sp. P-1104]|uniref:TOBE domain-containing protein n=1 Tax=Geitlerinema sp. P-1104 TaxID=2546230 RepID=UPI001476CD73
ALEDLSPNTSPPTLNLGIRPEDIQLSSEQPGSLAVRVSITEPLGRETLIRGVLDGQESANPDYSLNFFVPASIQPKPGERLWVTFPPENLLYFNPITEDLIRHK